MPDPTSGAASELPVPDRRVRRTGTVRAVSAIKARHAADRTPLEAFAQSLTDRVSSAPFLVLHVLWFGLWIGWNAGIAGAWNGYAFDPYPFGLLTMIVSLEAIFLSLFVLMGQERAAEIAELREEITLQVTLRMEEEVTKTLQLVAGLYTRMGHRLGEDAELREMLQPLDERNIEEQLVKQLTRDSKRQRAKR